MDSLRNVIRLQAVSHFVELLFGTNWKWIQQVNSSFNIHTSGYLSDYSGENYYGEWFLFAFTNSLILSR